MFFRFSGFLIATLIVVSVPRVCFASSDWESLLNKVIQSGKRMETIPGEEARYLDSVNPNDPNENRRADYLTARGRVSNGSPFRLLDVTGVSENWIREGNHWKIYQWLFQAEKADGSLISTRFRLIEKSVYDGSVRITELDPGDERSRNSRWLGHWKQFTDSSSVP